MSQTIRVYSANAVEYTWPTTITEKTGKDITGDAVTIGLGSYEEPSGLVVPDVLIRPTPSSASAQLLIGQDFRPARGEYWVWIFLPDTPEQVPRRGDRVTIC